MGNIQYESVQRSRAFPNPEVGFESFQYLDLLVFLSLLFMKVQQDTFGH